MTYTAAELLASPLPDPTVYVVDRLLRGNVIRPSMIVGYPRAGKSTATTQLAIAVANGTPIWGRETQQGHVIFWKTEDGLPETHAAFKKAGMTADSKVSFLFPKKLPVADRRLALRAELTKFPDTTLVVIETLSSYIGDVALNESRDVIKAFDQFYAEVIADFPKPAYLFIHQFNKNGPASNKAPQRALLRVNGSIFLSGETACSIYIDQNSDEDRRRWIMTEGREGDIDIEPTYLIFDAETNTSTLGGTVADERAAKTKEKQDKAICDVDEMIETALVKHPNIGKKDLYALLRKAGLKMGADAMRIAVQSNIDLGWITVAKDGKYERLTWKGISGLSPAPEPKAQPESVAVEVADEVPAGTITSYPSMGACFAVSGHMCKALNLTSPKYTTPWDVIAQNLLSKGHPSEYIIAVFDFYRSEDMKNDTAMRTTPEIFEKHFEKIAMRMTERTVTQ